MSTSHGSSPRRPVGDRERAVLGPVARRVDRADRDLAELHRRSVVERLVCVESLGRSVDVNRAAMVEREAPVSREVVGVRVSLEHADELHVVPRRLVEILLDGEGRVDDHGTSLVLVADEVRPAAEAVVDELAKDHDLGR